ncbi:MAG: hypothetical protein ACKV2U_04215, partial [Bryobacteraceae bacterium]
AARGMDAVSEEIPLADAPAFRQAVDTKETVVSLFAASQLSRPIAGEEGSSRRAHLFPLVGKTRVLGVLLAVEPDVYGLEVLLSLGAAALELREAKSSTLIAVAAQVELPTARRFARATVARWILEEPDLVSAGRARGDLYGAMRGLVDGARDLFGSRYLPGPDYLHEEMVARLGLGTGSSMGPGYPGPMGVRLDA